MEIVIDLEIKAGQQMSIEIVKGTIDNLHVRYDEFENIVQMGLKTNKVTVEA